jgi:hypothetical protein
MALIATYKPGRLFNTPCKDQAPGQKIQVLKIIHISLTYMCLFIGYLKILYAAYVYEMLIDLLRVSSHFYHVICTEHGIWWAHSGSLIRQGHKATCIGHVLTCALKSKSPFYIQRG